MSELKPISLYTSATPNGRKISIALEELGLEYNVRNIDLGNNEQKEDWFLSINPNGRIPAIIDHTAGDLTIFESGAILIYLAEKTGRLLPTNPAKRYAVMQWLFFQMSGLGPMQGQANVFYRYMENNVPEATLRYQIETLRLYGVWDQQLEQQPYIAGEFSIADIAAYPWIKIAGWAGFSTEAFPNIERWITELDSRPSFQRGLRVPDNMKKEDLLKAGMDMLVK